ncbi:MULTISPECIES: hypothetical protein [Legionella]|nr:MULTISPECIES: hypothetical protein [Legionella]
MTRHTSSPQPQAVERKDKAVNKEPPSNLQGTKPDKLPKEKRFNR